MNPLEPMIIDVVSDVVCPWCFLGERRLHRALEMLPDLAIEVRWRPYQLDPGVPKEGVDRQDYMAAKFKDPVHLEEIHARLNALGADEEIAFAFDAIARQPNSLDAHRLIRWAGMEGAQDAVVDRLFTLFFSEGADIGDHAVLVEAAKDAGMDGTVVARLLEGPSDVDAVRSEIETAQRIGVTGVPCFILDGKYAVMGAQEAESLAEAIRQAAEQRGDTEAAD
ncbi:Predicted dithiol-disulfide isomerase, DsbA family [Pseudoxanthobacter soli DSM 19599]|uniref:Predicted dithiol-disulfide isomerase, DsbA family n=1 Tax=Pseudoxanthobacter soli DSM 19599 TaxID=1123029 RepID=A0A1M7Z8B2_9HYPH|nr:DsbA family oxidoreductase [Pseudoxanthobacter soli]SHO61125.1 Predicted dithiol-disulfide isomerase, DsbA family [Pseudoxanthobacter soli DSM 19599]